MNQDGKANEQQEKEVLQARIDLLENVMNSFSDLIYVKDASLRTVYCNVALASILGKSPVDLYGKTDIENGWDPDFVKGNSKIGVRSYEADDLAALEGMVVHNPADFAQDKGQLRVFDTTKYPLRDGQGIIVALAGISRDVTERYFSEQEMRETRAILETALEQSSAGIAIADAPDGRLRYVNKAGLAIAGGTEKELVQGVTAERYALNWRLFRVEDGAPLPLDEIPLAKAIRYGVPTSREFIVRRPDNEDRIVFANAAPIYSNTGKITAAVVVFLDVSDLKKAENALMAEREHLKAILREKEEVEKNLKNAKEQAERATHAKGELLAKVSHDLRTPLNAILGALDLIRVKEPNVSQGLCNIIEENGKTLLTIVGDLLDAAKLDVHKLVIVNRPYEPRPLLLSTLKLFQDKVRSDAVKLEARVEATVPNVILGDPARMKQILMNLLDNAVKFTAAGFIRAVIAVEAAGGAETVVIRVEDSGSGMARGVLEKIFEPFEVFSDPQHCGTGLGLSIVKGLAEAMGGSVTVASTLGVGSKFEVVLPFQESPKI